MMKRSLTMVPAGNKAKRLSPVNHTTKNNSSWIDGLLLTNTPRVFHVETTWNTRGVFVGLLGANFPMGGVS